jgi:hypothetical protein
VVGERAFNHPCEVVLAYAEHPEALRNAEAAVQGVELARQVRRWRETHRSLQPPKLFADLGCVEAQDRRHQDGVERAVV